MTALDPSSLKSQVQARVTDLAPELVALSEDLHAHPETAWREVRSARVVGDLLERHGFAVERGYLGLETALHATVGSGPRRVSFLAEYDALPGVGHACGHNLISAMSVGAALALAPWADALGLTVEVCGTPAEEGGGGKCVLVERGAFAGVAFALMAHPGPADVVRVEPLAVSHSRIRYRGKASHASGSPETGVNAADAFTVAQTAIGLLRQHLPRTVRVHGIVTHGGEAPNIVPGLTEGRWYVRATTLAELRGAWERVRRCFEAGALATGCELEVEDESLPYSEMRTDEVGVEHYRANVLALGRTLHPDGPDAPMSSASTDMGNVSQVTRAIHPYIGLGCAPVVNHQQAFADACVGPVAERTLLDGATALAWTGVDLAHDWLASSGSPSSTIPSPTTSAEERA